mmetsp:Transcript_16370/g.33733  ORF Transcript_16370/g.33733 Transcript_16370/m.33733 type:complete len:210 (+) Transcript_16370:1893-2522(+)
MHAQLHTAATFGKRDECCAAALCSNQNLGAFRIFLYGNDRHRIAIGSKDVSPDVQGLPGGIVMDLNRTSHGRCDHHSEGDCNGRIRAAYGNAFPRSIVSKGFHGGLGCICRLTGDAHNIVTTGLNSYNGSPLAIKIFGRNHSMHRRDGRSRGRDGPKVESRGRHHRVCQYVLALEFSGSWLERIQPSNGKIAEDSSGRIDHRDRNLGGR